MKFLKGVGSIIARAEDFTMWAGLAMIALVVATEAFERWVMHSTPIGLEEFGLFCASFVYFIGAGRASRKRTHIAVDLISVKDSSSLWSHIIDRLSAIITILTAGTIAFFVIKDAIYQFQHHYTMVSLKWPLGILMVIAAIGFFLIVVYEIKFMLGLKEIVKARKKDSGAPA